MSEDETNIIDYNEEVVKRAVDRLQAILAQLDVRVDLAELGAESQEQEHEQQSPFAKLIFTKGDGQVLSVDDREKIDALLTSLGLVETQWIEQGQGLLVSENLLKDLKIKNEAKKVQIQQQASISGHSL